jgi:pimeloyl-ACP methyl ester carboxylesterase
MDYLSVFRSKYGEQQVLAAYDTIMDLWPVSYEEIYVPTSLGSTHVIICGPSDGAPVVMIHAYYASSASWYQTVGRLSKVFRVYLIDIIGDPNKSKPFRPIRKLADFLLWFNEVSNSLHIDNATFIGNSVGAFHIMNYALHSPGRVRKMVLIGPAASFLKITGFYLHTFPGGITGWPFLVHHAINWVENGAPLDPVFKKLFYLTMRYGKALNQVFPVVFSDDQLRRLKPPVLLIYGDRECIYDIDLAVKRATQLMRNLKIEIIPKANHLTAVSNSEMTNKAIINFLTNF